MTMTSGRKPNHYPAPQEIRRIAARRVFKRIGATKGVVTLTIGVPRRVPGSDWGCLVQVAGLDPWLRRPRSVFGVDSLQALHLALQFATVTLQTSKQKLKWLGAEGDLGLPQLLPNLPKAEEHRVRGLVDREVSKVPRRCR